MAILEVLDDAPPASDRKERLVIIAAAGTLEMPELIELGSASGAVGSTVNAVVAVARVP
jgi:hypothetical protein